MKTTLLSILISFQFAVFAQSKGTNVLAMKSSPGPKNTEPLLKLTDPPALIASIATSYTMSACGLNYLQVSKPLFQRTIPPYPQSPIQPVTYNVSGLPPCATVLKAFLYTGVLGSVATAITSTITNPSNITSSYSMTLVGGDLDLCWYYTGSFNYRADVTSAISGNGNYLISGIPVSGNGINDDAEGATLFIIYSDPSQAYTGNIVLADGCQANLYSACSSQITGFNVCGTPTLTEHFMILADMQGDANAEFVFNTPLPTPNHTVVPANQNIWDFASGPGAPAFTGQSSAEYGIVTVGTVGDCIGMMMAGMYYRNDCFTCTPTNSLAVTAVASTTTCPATVTANVSGGIGPYTYSWTPGAQTTSAVTLGSGNYTVNVTAPGGCSGSTAIAVVAPAPTLSITKPTLICKGSSIKLIAGAAASYSWSPSTYLNATNVATVIVTPTSTAPITYTLHYTNAGGCSNTTVTTLTVSNCTGIEGFDNEDSSLLIYPNPSSGNFIVESKTPVNLLLVNTLGQSIRSVELNSKNSNRASVTGIADGVYYLISKDRSQSIKQKVVVGK